jgi:hypothetical protein
MYIGFESPLKFIHTSPFSLFGQIPPSMSRQLAIQRGKKQDTQSFSSARPIDPDIEALLEETLKPSIDVARRFQILHDIKKVTQFSLVWGDRIGYLTRPTLYTGDDNVTVVVGSFSDVIGQALPVAIPLDAFHGYFTTLVPRAVADRYQLPQSTQEPDTIPPPVQQDDEEDIQDQPTIGRLHFYMDVNIPENRPVIAAFPHCLPIPPGRSYPNGLAIDDQNVNLLDTFPLFEAYRQGLAYIRQHNANTSVTTGGPLFDKNSLEVSEQLESLKPKDQPAPVPVPLPPFSEAYHQVEASIKDLSEDLWAMLGDAIPIQQQEPIDLTVETRSQSNPVVVSNDVENIIAKTVQAIQQGPTRPKELTVKEQELADTAVDVATRYRLLFASVSPAEDGLTMEVVLPDVKTDFMTNLKKTRPVSASTDLKELLNTILEIAANSDKAIDNMVQFHEAVVSVMFSNCVRSFHWLETSLNQVTCPELNARLSIVHFLPPEFPALMQKRVGEAADSPIIQSLVADAKSQFDASKASTLYTGGKLHSQRDAISAVCNFRALAMVVFPTTHVDDSALMKKLRQYCKALQTRDGQRWWDLHRHNPDVLVNVICDMHSIIIGFIKVSASHQLRGAAKSKDPISPVNFQLAINSADRITTRLNSAILSGNLGDYALQPRARSFLNTKEPTAPLANNDVFKDSTNTQGGNIIGSPVGRRKQPDTPSASQPQAKKNKGPPDEAILAERRKKGILVFDSKVPGAPKKLPLCPVFAKIKPTSPNEERCCHFFMIQGQCCTNEKCKHPHISSINKLPQNKQAELIKFVEDTPGMAFAPGKGPSGTHSA